ncbi:hypothetical protein GMSM_02330 [Geomonas sp. Red276]
MQAAATAAPPSAIVDLPDLRPFFLLKPRVNGPAKSAPDLKRRNGADVAAAVKGGPHAG